MSPHRFLWFATILVGSSTAMAQTLVTVNRHATGPEITDKEVDQILAAGQDLLQKVDGPDDVEVQLKLQRRGPVGKFAAGNGVIDTLQAFQEAHGAPGEVKIVRSITWCGQVNASIIGCAQIGINGMSIVIERFTPDQEGILWMHEYGHNRGLQHRNAANALMRDYLASTHTRVNQTEANAFLNGPNQVGAAVAAAVPGEGDGPGDDEVPDVREFVRRPYFHGIPYEVASRLPKEDVPVLLEMLKDREQKPYWTNIVVTLGFMGDERAVKPLLGFVRNAPSEMDPEEFRAVQGTLIHLGDLINKSGNQEALAFLKRVAEGYPLRDAGMAAAKSDVSPVDPDDDFQTAAVLGLALSGKEEAGDLIRELNKVAPAGARDRGALKEAQEVFMMVRGKGLKFYRESSNR